MNSSGSKIISHDSPLTDSIWGKDQTSKFLNGNFEMHIYFITAEDVDQIPESGRTPGVGNCNLLQYSCLENYMDRGAWQARVHGSQRVRHD